MVKSIFLDIIKDPVKRDNLNFLKDKREVYELFCKNGYKEDFYRFEDELNEFLNSDEIRGVLRGEHLELSDEMLEMVSGGFAFRKFVVGGVVSLMAVCSSAVAIPDDFDSSKFQQTQISCRTSGGVGNNSSVFWKKRKLESEDEQKEGGLQEDDGDIVKSVIDELEAVLRKFAKARAQEKNLRKNRQKDDNDIKKFVNDELEEALEKFAKIRAKEQKSKKNNQRHDNFSGRVI